MDDYIQKLLRDEDKDFYLLSLFVTPQHRDAVQVLLAFNHEIAKTRAVVTETAIGLMRLLWWREAVQEIYAGNLRQGNPVLLALESVIKEYDLPQKAFEDLTLAREFDLEGVLPRNMEGLLNYAQFISEPLVKLISKVVGEQDCYNAVPFMIIDLVRNIPLHARQYRIMMPADLLEQQGLSEDAFLEMADIEKIRSIVQQVISSAEQLLIKQNEPKSSFFKAMNALTFIYLKKIRSVNYNILDPRMAVPPLFKELRVWAAASF